MGCGDGGGVAALAGLGAQAEGIDIRQGGEAWEGRVCAVGDMRSLPYGDAAFDGVLCECSLSACGDIPLALSEASRALRRGGMLLISDVFAGKRNSALPTLLEWEGLITAGGFRILSRSEANEAWRSYVVSLLWEEGPDALEGYEGVGESGYFLMCCVKAGV